MAGDGSTVGGWYPDPFGRHQLRYWDGKTWTAHVSNNGVTASDSPLPSPQQNVVAPPFVAPAISAISTAPDTPKKSKGKWILIGGLAVVVIIVIATVAGGSDDSGSSGGDGSFKIRIADQATFMTADYGSLFRLGDDTNAPGYCDDAAQSLQEASGIVASWSTPLKNAWNAAEGHFETAITACRAGDGQAMVRAYGRAETTLERLRTLLSNLDCQLDQNDPGGVICR